MNPAIIFDMDGVIIKSEALWDTYEGRIFKHILTPDVYKQIVGTTRGLSEAQIYNRLIELGHTGPKDELYAAYDKAALKLYQEAPITPDFDSLLHNLQKTGVSLGLISASPLHWVQLVLNRLPHNSAFTFIESVNDHPELRPKPAPDGYIAAIKALGSTPYETLIIEDSQTGVNAAISSGAHVCCFTFHHDNQELPHGVEVYAHTIEDLQNICYSFAGTMTLNSPVLA